MLDCADSAEPPRPYSEEETARLFEATVGYWRRWMSQSRYGGRWRETVHRSALTLKLLTYRPTGAIVAAPTTSLPERVGGERNWDYRYTWIRDAAFSLYALLRLGFTEEAAAFMGWLIGPRPRAREPYELGPLQIMYGIDGRADLEEFVLDHFEGYRGSRPVRIGNAAADQLQLDIYGELIDSVYLYNKYGEPIGHDAWENVTRIVDWLSENWDRADEGIWEMRGGRKHFTYSRLMCWVALERSIRIARQRGLPGDVVSWLEIRDRIYHQIMERGWHESRKSFVQHFDADTLDASVLLMPLTKFMSPTDPRWLSTLDAIGRHLVSDSLVYRYDVEASPDGLEGEEGTFSICTFWYVEALARAGRVDEARLAFEKMLTYANHLGLYSEEIGLDGRAARQLPAGVHPPRADQRRVQPRPGARVAAVRVAFISDLHGNLPALEAVLRELEHEEFDELICLGDVAVGPQPHETLMRVRELGCPVIMGNWDAAFIDGMPAVQRDDEVARNLVEIGAWWAGALTEDDRSFIAAFRPWLELEVDEDKRMLCFHGSPSSYNDWIFAHTPEDEVLRMFGDHQAPVMVGGHTHLQLVRRLHGSLLVNVGSVGLPFRQWWPREVRIAPWAEYGLLEFQDGRTKVDLRRTTFDVDALLELAMSSGMPHAEWWRKSWAGD